LTGINGIQLIVVHHLTQLSQDLCWLAIAPATVSFFSAIIGQELLEGFDASSAFNQMCDVDLGTKEVSHVAFVIVQRCDEEEVHEGYTISSAVEESAQARQTAADANLLVEKCFGDLLASFQSFYQSIYAGRRRLGTLQKATVATNHKIFLITTYVVEGCSSVSTHCQRKDERMESPSEA
jgi:hypothetical protein